MTKVNRRTVGKMISGGLMMSILPAKAWSQGAPLRILVPRSPGYIFIAEKIAANRFGVAVEVEPMLVDKIFEVSSIAFSANAPGIDVLYLNDSGVQQYASKGWLEPLDELWAKFQDEYKLDDFPPIVMDAMRVDGSVYALPFALNTQMLFYRKDILGELNIPAPKEMSEYVALPPRLKEAGVPNINGGMQPTDYALNRLHWFLNAIGDGWFDAEWRPTFNSPKGIEAVQTIKDLVPFVPKGWTNSGNDEDSLNLSQGISSVGLHWTSRAGQMQDPTKSTVVDKIAWAPAPGGGARIALDGLAIPKSSTANKEQLFQMIAEAISPANMKENAGRVFPSRVSVQKDPELQARYPWYEAASQSLATNKTVPAIPEFVEISVIVVRRVMQALTNEAEIKPSLDAAAEEVTALLTERGYYK